jgi:hypothetical protein
MNNHTKIIRKVGVAFAILVVMSALIANGANNNPPPTPASISIDLANGANPTSYSCPSNPLFSPVTISGHGAGSAPPGNIEQYHVKIDWGDGNFDNEVPATFSPSSGKGDFTFNFTAGPHIYTTVGNTNFTITALLYHSNPSGNDNQTEATVTINVCIKVLPPSTGALKVIKNVINDSGSGSATPNQFTINVAGGNATPASFQGDSNGMIVTINAGEAYTVSEDQLAGYLGTLSDECSSALSGTLLANEIRTCTITNDDTTLPPAPKLTVVKTIVNDNGGTKQISDFPLFIDNQLVISGDQITLASGSHTVTEITQAGYIGTFGGDCDSQGQIILADGDQKTCTIINNDQPATLYVIKHVINNDIGTMVASDFSITVTGNNPTPANFNGVENPGTAVTIDAGPYSVDEALTIGYDKTLSTDCVGTINVGETKTCTITNNDIPPTPPTTGTLVVVKHVINDNGGTEIAEDFKIVLNGENPSLTSFNGSESGVDITLDPGDYNVDEDTATGYSKTLSAECSGTMVAGETKTCTITNNDIQAKLTVFKIVVNDDAGTSQISDFPLFVGSTTVTSGEQIDLDAGSYVVSETQQSGYTQSFSGDCDQSGNIMLDVGDIKSCTITNDDFVQDTGGGGDSGGFGGGGGSSPTDSGSSSGGGGGGALIPVPSSNSGSGSSTGLGQASGLVLGASTGPLAQGEVLGELVCSVEYLKDYLRMNKQNDPEQVRKLQEFLNNNILSNLPLTGYFGRLTHAAVEQFQLKYKEQILRPWVPYGLSNENTPTGYVYKTTKRWINMLECPDLNLPIPQLP